MANPMADLKKMKAMKEQAKKTCAPKAALPDLATVPAATAPQRKLGEKAQQAAEQTQNVQLGPTLRRK